MSEKTVNLMVSCQYTIADWPADDEDDVGPYLSDDRLEALQAEWAERVAALVREFADFYEVTKEPQENFIYVEDWG